MTTKRERGLEEALRLLARSARTVFGALPIGQSLQPAGSAHTNDLIYATDEADKLLSASPLRPEGLPDEDEPFNLVAAQQNRDAVRDYLDGPALCARSHPPLRPEGEALVWRHGEARSSLGDLYSVHHLSENVWSTRKNGVIFGDWKPREAEAKALAQFDCDAHISALSARPQPPQQPVAVKPLDWKELVTDRGDGTSEPSGDWEADAVTGGYYLQVTEGRWSVERDDYTIIGLSRFPSPDEAKAAAQADYEKRIRSALYAAPLAQPVADSDEFDEAYAIGKRDGYEEAIQELDVATGGDGEFKGSSFTGETVDVPVMRARIIERFAQPVATVGEERADLFPITGAILDAGRMAFEQIEYLDGMPSEEVVLTILKAISAAAYRPPVTQPNAEEAGK